MHVCVCLCVCMSVCVCPCVSVCMGARVSYMRSHPAPPPPVPRPAGPVIIACPEGGTSIEDLAEKYPSKIIKVCCLPTPAACDVCPSCCWARGEGGAC